MWEKLGNGPPARSAGKPCAPPSPPCGAPSFCLSPELSIPSSEKAPANDVSRNEGVPFLTTVNGSSWVSLPVSLTYQF